MDTPTALGLVKIGKKGEFFSNFDRILKEPGKISHMFEVKVCIYGPWSV